MVLLMLVPLASGTTLLWPDEVEPIDGERLLVLKEGVWTSQQWASLAEQGIQPLRTVDPQTLLVWGDMGDVSLPADFVILEAPPAEYKPGLAPSNGPGEFRVLLEPRLPEEAVGHIQSTLVRLGLSITSTSLDVGGNLPGSVTVSAPGTTFLESALAIDGVLWIEPVLSPHARNEQAGSIIESGSLGEHPYWTVGLNGTGVVVGVADSGLDADHACFRNATTASDPNAEPTASYPAIGIYGEHHRKILFLNASIDGNDTPGHSDYRHGTHVIGSLGCHDVDAYRQNTVPGNGSTLAHGTRLVVQDIVSSEGWTPPNVDALLWESSSYGGVVHSNSWGDDTTAYTERTGRFDAYARVMPWSLALIAPGNSGEGVLEPANGRNVVAVSATTKNLEEGRWSASAYGPTEAGTDGVFLLAPGANIQSAGADGFLDTNNHNLRLSSGTSMATPHASGAAAVIQQLYEDGWLVPAQAPVTLHYLNDLQPSWAEAAPMMRGVYLGEGFTPSGSLLRASLAMASTPLADDVRNGGNGGYDLHNPYDGWGVLNLSHLFDPSEIVNGQSPTSDTWVHDSYRLSSGSVAEWFEHNKGETSDLSGMVEAGASLNQSVGPFLQTGDVFTQRLTLIGGEDVRIRMAFPAQPEPAMVDDLQLRVRLENGMVLLPDELREGGFAPTEFFPGVVDTNNTTAFPPTNETVVGLNIPQSILYGSSYLDVDVVARFVQPGGEAGTTGLDGDAVGFALVVKGVDRDSTAYEDGDNDGVINTDDACPTIPAPPEFDANRDGCLDDDDMDGVPNRDDQCPAETAPPEFDVNRDGCLDDDDMDGVPNRDDRCPNSPTNGADENSDGCDDTAQWSVAIKYNDGCSGCSVDIRYINVRVAGVSVHEYTGTNGDYMLFDSNSGLKGWKHVLDGTNGGAEIVNLSRSPEVELEVQMRLNGYSVTTSSGYWSACWPTSCHTYVGSWDVDFQLYFGDATEANRIVTISGERFIYGETYTEHRFVWDSEITIDADGDGFTVPGVQYSGQCTEDYPVEVTWGVTPSPCKVERNNDNDAFPLEATQWSDRDGDGFGDNPEGFQPDAFPDDWREWDDIDGDGVGSNSDYCVDEYGTSTFYYRGCLDEDKDGFADQYLDHCPTLYGTSNPTGGYDWGWGWGCPDSDEDGYPDPQSGMTNFPEDMCPETYGLASTSTGRGCVDSDRDGWANFEDDLPDDPDYHLDSDGDGVADEEDDFPNNALLSDDDQVGGLWFSGCGLVFMVVVFFVTRNKLPPTPKTFNVGRF